MLIDAQQSALIFPRVLLTQKNELAFFFFFDLILKAFLWLLIVNPLVKILELSFFLPFVFARLFLVLMNGRFLDSFFLLYYFSDVPRESCTDSAALDKVVAFNRTCYDLQLNEGNTFAKARGSCLKQRGDLWNHVSKSAFELIVRELERRKHTMKVTQHFWHLFLFFLQLPISSQFLVL